MLGREVRDIALPRVDLRVRSRIDDRDNIDTGLAFDDLQVSHADVAGTDDRNAQGFHHAFALPEQAVHLL